MPEAAAAVAEHALRAWIVATVPLCVQLDRLAHGPVALARVAVVNAVVLAVGRRRPRAAVAVAAAALAVSLLDRSVPAVLHVVAVVSVLTWGTLEGVVRLPRRLPDAARVGGTLLLGIAGVLLFAATGVRIPAALTAAGAAVTAAGVVAAQRRSTDVRPVAANSPMRRLAQAANDLAVRVGDAAGAVVGAVAMVPAAVAVTTGWLGHRLAGHDVLATPAGRATRWAARDRPDPDPARAFADVRLRDDRTIAATARRALGGVMAGLLTVVGLGATGVGVARALPEQVSLVARGPVGVGAECLRTPAVPNPVMDEQPGAKELVCESREYVSRPRFDAITTYEYADFDGEHLNVTDGVRAGWRPPPCGGCKRLTMWWFGGSAAFGWDQRDDHTISSEVAKEAWRRGVALDVVNHALSGQVLGQELHHFQELAKHSDPPDLVAFYDGGNELARQKEREARGRGTDESDTSFLEVELDDFLWNGPPEAGLEPWERATWWPLSGGERITPEETATHAMNRYRRHARLAIDAATRLGVEPVLVWQPLMHSAPAVASLPGSVPEVDVPIWERMLPEALSQLPPEVIDLSDSLDGVDRPVFNDFYHTNEYAAKVVARQLVDRIWPRIEALAG